MTGTVGGDCTGAILLVATGPERGSGRVLTPSDSGPMLLIPELVGH